MAATINVTPRLEQGLRIANQLDSNKFRLLVSRICQTLQFDLSTKVFSEEEEEKLLVSLDLNKNDLTLLLDGIISIYTETMCNVAKPLAMETILRETFKIDEDKVQIFISAWVAYGKGIIDNLKQKSIFPLQVKDINWSLNIQASSSIIKEGVIPVALLELGLPGEKNSKLTVEFDKKELTKLYEDLEKIQAQLDTLK